MVSNAMNEKYQDKRRNQRIDLWFIEHIKKDIERIRKEEEEKIK